MGDDEVLRRFRGKEMDGTAAGSEMGSPENSPEAQTVVVAGGSGDKVVFCRWTE